MRVLLIDNYDSFTFNLVQALRALGAEVDVFRNDAITVSEALQRDPTHLVVSPGPGRPEDAGVTVAAIDAFAGRVPILGVCLGHQALGLVLGGKVTRAHEGPMHGKPSPVHHDGRTLYTGLPSPFVAGRYHSLVVEDVDGRAEVAAWTAEGTVMGLRVPAIRAEGVQFHPESVLTPDGPRLLANFLGGRA